jgi:hypothetical protein
MNTPNSAVSTSPSTWLQSTGVIFLGFFVVAVISLATDEVLHLLKVYPPWGEPMYQPGLNALALSYRIVYGILGGNLAARLAPHHPMRHAMILGTLGFVVSVAGVIATLPMHLGPAWYPIALAVTALPCSWAGAKLYRPAQ